MGALFPLFLSVLVFHRKQDLRFRSCKGWLAFEYIYMPIWFLNRPENKADPIELKVAQVFNKLEGNWYIRWGYYYNRNKDSDRKDREGDFVLLGPDGHILVVEVKSGQNRHFVLTGEWEYADDNPAYQLHKEWQAVIAQLNEASSNQRIPYVGKALCLPQTNLLNEERLQGELSKDQLIFGKDLEDFPAWWSRHVASKPTKCSDPVKVFHSGVAKGMQPAAIKMFLQQSDQLFDRFKASEFEILTMLQGNRQWMVEGGVGTGKTFFALQQASWLAQQGAEGQSVLLLVYNLMLAERLQQMVARLKLTCGEIILHSWESLLEEILTVEKLKLESPEEADARRGYYRDDLPAYIRILHEDGKIQPRYDALVVDEAQDHDTRFAEGNEDAAPLGWWSWYFALLKSGADAQVALFYDPAQRPAFRGADRFDADLIRGSLSQAVHVRLPRALRYTRPILDYLTTLEGSATKLLAGSLQPHKALPTGPDVELREADKDATASAVESILQQWKDQELCKPCEVVLIGMRKELATSSLSAVETLCGFDLVDYSEQQRGKLSYIGAHRSKGLDFLAVILVDFEPFGTIPEADRQEAFFMGASRARQLLGVVQISPSP